MNYYDVVTTAPAATDGIPTGDGSWRFAVQVAIANGGARVGVSKVDVARVSSSLAWYDITSSVAGAQWTRGAPRGSIGYPRANVGVGSFTLTNDDRLFSPWTPPTQVQVGSTIDTTILQREWGPRALIRVVMFTGTPSTSASVGSNGFSTITRTNWYPRFTGFVESWDERIVNGLDIVEVTAVETMVALADIDETPVAAEGANETLIDRLVRIFAASDFTFPIVEGNTPNAFDDGGYLLQATTLSGNRLAECYLAAESVQYTQLIPGTDGSVVVGYCNPLETLGGYPYGTSLPIVLAKSKDASVASDATRYPNGVVAYYAEPVTFTNNADAVVNEVRATRVGGTEQVQTSTRSVGRYGKRSMVRSDLIGFNDTMALYFASLVIQEAAQDPAFLWGHAVDQTIQPSPVTITDQHDAQRIIDLGQWLSLDWYDDDDSSLDLRMLGRIVQTVDSVTPVEGGITWATTFTILSRHNYY